MLAYAFFVLAAGARSAVQLSMHASRAPLAYALSAIAAVVYLAGLVVVALADRRPDRRPLAVRLVLAELSGVVIVGSASVLWPRAFPDATVWSGFGSGYGYVPVLLPVLALAWLIRGGRLSAGAS